MANLGSFDPSQVNDDRQLLPDGTYVAQIIESDVVPTKAGTGQILKLTFEITEGALERRRIWDQVNIANQNAQAQEIGQRHLKRLCDALGVGVIHDSSELHFKPVRIRVTTKPAEGQYDASNQIKGFEAYGRGGAPAREMSPPPSRDRPVPPDANRASPPQQAAAGGMPWRR